MTQPAPAPTTPPAGDPPTTPPADPGTPPGTPPTDPAGDKPLGPGGEKALAAEREARKALEKQLADLAPLKQLADLLGGKPTGDGTTDLQQLTERLGKHEVDLAAEREARWRAEVANSAGLTLDQASRLRGTTREELAADAVKLKELFPSAPAGAAGGARNPAPDPSQGNRGGQPADLDAQIAAAAAKGDYKAMIALKAQKLAGLKPTS